MMRYVADPVGIARMLGTQDATALLSSAACEAVYIFPTEEQRHNLPLHVQAIANKSQYAHLVSPNLQDASVHARALHPGDYAITFDLKKSFLQCPLFQQVRPYFTYKVRGQWYSGVCVPHR